MTSIKNPHPLRTTTENQLSLEISLDYLGQGTQVTTMSLNGRDSVRKWWLRNSSVSVSTSITGSVVLFYFK